jgi:hypothetical protein
MGILSYNDFLKEEETVKMDSELREYTLTHMKDDRFQLKSKNFFKEFSVLPYKGELVEPLKQVHGELVKAIDTSNVENLYKAIKKAESIPYSYGGIFTSNYSLSEVPEFSTSLDVDQQRSLGSSEREFLLNNFSRLGKNIKDEVIETLRERAEVLCSVIEALFYYIRTIDKENFYKGMNSEEIVEEYQTVIEKASKEVSFSFKGPFDSLEGQNNLTENSRTGYWECEKNMKKFFIQATVQPKELYSEENIGGTMGLKFSLITPDDKNPPKDYSFFNIDELVSRVKAFYDNILKK